MKLLVLIAAVLLAAAGCSGVRGTEALPDIPLRQPGKATNSNSG
jgi:hypothetical protein